MNLLNKMERKLGRFAIPNLTLYIIITYVVGYVLSFVAAPILSLLQLDPYYILHGQVWRIVSWLLIPPDRFDIFTLIMLFFYYSIGTSLEQAWGAFRYNVYIFGGILLTVIGAFVLYFIMGSGIPFFPFSLEFSTYYISLSIFLGYAATYPNQQVLLYFIIPIKIKWLAYLDIIYLIYAMVRSGWGTRVAIICSIMNFIIFFLLTRNHKRFTPKEINRKRAFKKAVHRSQTNITKHKCAVCGRTDEENSNLEFRFCSKCKGNYEYCQEHLFTHEHIK